MTDSNSKRDVTAMRIEVTLNGEELPRPLSVRFGTEARYAHYDHLDVVGSYEGFSPKPVELSFPITKSKILRSIGQSETEMQKDHQVTVRFLANNRKQPLATATLVNVRFKEFEQGKDQEHPQPTEFVVGTAERIQWD